MMKNLFKLSLVLMVGTVLITACGKYEEGPAISVLPKKMRLTGTYTIDKVVLSDGTEQSSNDNSEYTYEGDGTFRVTNGSISTEGIWEFKNDKSDLYTMIDFWGYKAESTREIIKLTNKELWLKSDDGSEEHYIKE